MQASGVQAMTRDARVDFKSMHHETFNIALERIAAIAAKAHTWPTKAPAGRRRVSSIALNIDLVRPLGVGECDDADLWTDDTPGLFPMYRPLRI